MLHNIDTSHAFYGQNQSRIQNQSNNYLLTHVQPRLKKGVLTMKHTNTILIASAFLLTATSLSLSAQHPRHSNYGDSDLGRMNGVANIIQASASVLRVLTGTPQTTIITSSEVCSPAVIATPAPVASPPPPVIVSQPIVIVPQPVHVAPRPVVIVPRQEVIPSHPVFVPPAPIHPSFGPSPRRERPDFYEPAHRRVEPPRQPQPGARR